MLVPVIHLLRHAQTAIIAGGTYLNAHKLSESIINSGSGEIEGLRVESGKVASIAQGASSMLGIHFLQRSDVRPFVQ